MRPVVTDVSFVTALSPAKTTEPIKMQFGGIFAPAQESMYQIRGEQFGVTL